MATIGDLIQADLAADADEKAKQFAAAAADQALADAKIALGAADHGLALGLNAVGSAFTADTTGAVAVYFPDSSDRGFHAIKPAAASTVIPAPPPTPPAVVEPAPTHAG